MKLCIQNVVTVMIIRHKLYVMCFYFCGLSNHKNIFKTRPTGNFIARLSTEASTLTSNEMILEQLVLYHCLPTTHTALMLNEVKAYQANKCSLTP